MIQRQVHIKLHSVHFRVFSTETILTFLVRVFFLRIGRELTWFAFLSGAPYRTVRQDAEVRAVSPKIKNKKVFF